MCLRFQFRTHQRVCVLNFVWGGGGGSQWIWTRIQEAITASREKWNLRSLLCIFSFGSNLCISDFVFNLRFADLFCI